MNIFDTIAASPVPITVDEDTYWYALEVLPPIYGYGCFAMGEAAGYASTGEYTYYWFTKLKGIFYGILGTKIQAENAFREIQ